MVKTTNHDFLAPLTNHQSPITSMQTAYPSIDALPHEVTLTRNPWTQDADGGRQVQQPPVIVQRIGCSVQIGRPRLERTDDQETGDRAVRQILPALVIFDENPKLKADDLITWTDSDPDGEDSQTHVFAVLSQRDPVGQRVVWAVECEERI